MAAEGTISSKLFQTELLKKYNSHYSFKRGRIYTNLIYKNIKIGLAVMEDF